MGNEYCDKDNSKENNGYEQNVELNSDLYLLLAALELNSVIILHMNHLAENCRAARLPTVIHELYNESNKSLLSDTLVAVSQESSSDPHEAKPADSEHQLDREGSEMSSKISSTEKSAGRPWIEHQNTRFSNALSQVLNLLRVLTTLCYYVFDCALRR